MNNLTDNEKALFEYYKKTGKPMRLNIGSRNKPLPQFINVDVNPQNELADVIDNGFTLEKFEDNSITEITSSHMNEHLSVEETDKCFQVWYRKLKPGGIVRISVPDGKKAAALLLLTGDRVHKALFMGRQRPGDEWDFHKNLFTKEWLSEDLEKAGFINVKEWQWQTTFPHGFCDSFVSAYYPPFNKKFIRDDGKFVDFHGVEVSLNLQAEKPKIPIVPINNFTFEGVNLEINMDMDKS